MTLPHTPAEAFTPGEYLRDELEERGWTVTEFADVIGWPIQAVSEILNAKKSITPDTALSLSEALGTSAELWLNLQTAHQLYQRRWAGRSSSPPLHAGVHLPGEDVFEYHAGTFIEIFEGEVVPNYFNGFCASGNAENAGQCTDVFHIARAGCYTFIANKCSGDAANTRGAG